MNIRQKGQAVRVTFTDTSRPQETPYVLIEPAQCWSMTFNSWGKKADVPIIALGSKRYRVTLQEIE